MTERSDSNLDTEQGRTRRIPRRVLVGIIVLAMCVAGAAVAGRHGWRHGQHGDPEAMRGHMTKMLERGLDEIEATDEQRVEIEVIAGEAFDAMIEMRSSHKEGRGQLIELVGAESIDRDAIEALRIEHIDQADRASQVLVTAAAEVLEVLTPEQRAELVEHFESRRHRHGKHGRRDHDDREAGDDESDGA